MKIFNKNNYILPPNKEEEIKNLIKESAIHLLPLPNNNVEFVAPLSNIQKYYKHLKKQIWKFSHR